LPGARRRRIAAVLAVGIVLCLLGGVSTIRAKSYEVQNMAVQALVQPDGRVLVEEATTYDFDGSFKFAYRDIPLGQGVAVDDIRVEEGGRPYTRSDSEEPGTFKVARNSAGIRVTWYYRAKNEARTFELAYTLKGAVLRYPDTAVMYQQFVGNDWDRPIGEVAVTVRFPEGVGAGAIQAWAHGPLHGYVEPPGDGLVRFGVSPLPKHTFWEGRILFPAEAVPLLELAGEKPQAEIIRQEEGRLVEEANRRRLADDAKKERQFRWASILFPIALVLGVLALVLWFVLWLRNGRPHPVARRAVPGEIPSAHPPALVSRLVTGMLGGRALVATLLDLARRGHFRIHEEKREERVFLSWTKEVSDYRFEWMATPEDDIEPFEDELRSLLHELTGGGAEFRMSDLKKAARKERRRVRRWFESWKSRISQRLRDDGLSEPYPVGAMVLNAVCGILVAGAGIVIMLVTSSPAGLPALVGGGLQAVLTAALHRRTPEGRRLTLAWNEFRRHIKRTSKSLGPVSLASSEWERYLVYAVIFGLHEPLGKVMELSLAGTQTAVFPWYVATAGHGHGLGGISGLTGSVSSMVTSVSSTMSSVSGSGGGASGGGGGGAGGGGGGAG
jgi:uncharacterized membrane protein